MLNAETLARIAVESVTEELDTTPKAGLVDKNNNGAHKDMNYPLLLSSIMAISPFFYQFAQAALDVEKVDDTENLYSLAQSLKRIGISAEKEMYRVTCGVNTHKGAVFCMALCIAAAGICAKSGQNGIDDFCRNISKTAEQLAYDNINTHGQKVRAQYKIDGAIETARKGYRFLLQTTKNYFAQEKPLNTLDIKNLLYIMSVLDDTNVYFRGGISSSNFVKRRAIEIYEKWKTEEDYGDIVKLNDEFVARNISVGGSADMLAVAIFTRKLIEKGILSYNR